MENFITLKVNSTRYFLIDCKDGKLLVDAGWEMAQFAAQMKANKISFSEIHYVLFTHHHPDHAGLIQNIKNLSGAKLIIHQKQIPFLENFHFYYQKKGGYEPIRVEKDDLISPSRVVLQAHGIDAEIVETPGHSDDSISLVFDSGMAFIGDLPLPIYAAPESAEMIRASWKKLIDRKVQVFYHSHAKPIPAEQVREILTKWGT